MNKIIHGDCLEEMKNIEDGSIDMILCDLPYGTTVCKWDTIIPFEPLWEQYYRVLRPNGFIVLTASQPFTTKLINSNIGNFSHQWIWQKEQGANPLLANKVPMKNFEDVIVFSKESYDSEMLHPLRLYFLDEYKKTALSNIEVSELLGNQMGGHYFTNGLQFTVPTLKNYEKLQTTGKFQKKYEEIKKIDDEFKNKYPRVYNPQKTKGKKYKSEEGFLQHTGTFKDGGTISEERYPTSIIKFNTDKSKSKHPTQKPVALFEYLIKTYTNEGDLVLDNCAGSGTTGVACKNLNRDFILIEKEEKYIKIIKERLTKT